MRTINLNLNKLIWLLQTYSEKIRIRLEDKLLLSKYECSFNPSGFTPTSRNSTVKSEIVSIFLFSPGFTPQALSISLDSLVNQTNPNWVCFVVNPTANIAKILSQFNDQRIKEISFEDIFETQFLQFLSLCDGNYFCVINPGDTLCANFVETLAGRQEEILFFDHGITPFNKNKFHYFLKPQWSPELWLNVDILKGAAFRISFVKNMVAKYGNRWMAGAILNAQEIVHIPQSIITSFAFPWENETEREKHHHLVEDYLNLQGVPLPNISYRNNGSFKFNWQKSTKKVSIIIPNRDQPKILRRCLESIFQKTDYPNFEVIIVDDNSQNQELLDFYHNLKREKQNFRIITGQRPFNFSQACNLGASNADGEFLLFLNNDTEIISPDWLRNLVGVVRLPGVGAVGAKLIYPNGRVQHAGVIIGLEGHASHVFQGVADDPFTPYGYVDWMRNVSAVTAACMIVNKEIFWKVGGFDEQFQIAFGDIDFCLRLRDAGYRIVYTPDATLIHHEGKSRGKYIPAHDILVKRDYFLEKIKQGDPYYHPALSRAWRIPTLRRKWEQNPEERFLKIITYFGI